MEQTEQPLYVLQQIKKRALIPKIISLVVLSVIFYLGVLLNVSLLKLSGTEETVIRLVALILLLSVVAVGIYISFHQANQPYKFYKSGVLIRGKIVSYGQIVNTESKIEMLDKIFKTYSINLGNGKFIRNVSQEVQIKNYLDKLINYAKQQTN